MSNDVSAATTASVEAEKASPVVETPTIEVPKVEPLKSETPQADIKPEIPAERVVSIKSKLAARPRATRYAVLAASIAIAAALGSVVGALAGAALMRPAHEADAVPTMNANVLNKTLAQLSADVSSLKTALDSSSKATSTQLSKISERVERAEKAQADTAQKAARLLETPKSAAQAPADVTGSIVEKQQVRPAIVEGWVIRDIFDGRAMVESRYGIFEVSAGAPLPGLGKVESVRRQDGRWVVVTPKGLIVSSR
jgi:hypothetical protein